MYGGCKRKDYSPSNGIVRAISRKVVHRSSKLLLNEMEPNVNRMETNAQARQTFIAAAQHVDCPSGTT